MGYHRLSVRSLRVGVGLIILYFSCVMIASLRPSVDVGEWSKDSQMRWMEYRRIHRVLGNGIGAASGLVLVFLAASAARKIEPLVTLQTLIIVSVFSVVPISKAAAVLINYGYVGNFEGNTPRYFDSPSPEERMATYSAAAGIVLVLGIFLWREINMRRRQIDLDGA